MRRTAHSTGQALPANLSAGHYVSFVIRIWSREGSPFQGQITHLSTRKTVRFVSVERMLAFMLEHLGQSPADAPVAQLVEDATEEERE